MQQSIFTDTACVNALRIFAESRHVHSTDHVLRTIPAAARALLMGRFQSDDSLHRSTIEQKKFYVRSEHLVGTEGTLVRSLALAFAAAIEHGQRTGTRPTYKEMAGKHYVGAGAGLANAIERFSGCTNVEQRNTNGAALQLDEITRNYDRRLEELTNMVQHGRDPGREGGRRRQQGPDYVMPTLTHGPRPFQAPRPPPMPFLRPTTHHGPPMPPPPMPPPSMPPPYHMQFMPPPHLQAPWAPQMLPLAPRPPPGPIPQPYAFQQPGLGLRQDGRPAVPPQLGHPTQSNDAADVSQFRAKGRPTSLHNPFARDFGNNAHTIFLRQKCANIPTSTQQVARHSFRFPGPFAH